MNVTKQLYQWDTGQKLTECTGIYVDYLIGDEVYRVEITDGNCIIPDELLQTSGRYKVWECMADNTLREFAFKVLPRPIPPNYVYTPTERLTFEGLVQKVDDAIADMISSADSELVKTNSELAKTNSELAKTNLYLDALYKLNKGQTYDVLEQESEAYSVDVPSGAKYVGVDKVGGKSVAWNQLASVLPNTTRNGLAYSTDNGKISITGTVQGAPQYGQFPLIKDLKFKRDGRKYLILLSQTLNIGVSGYNHASRNAFFFSMTTGKDWGGFIFLYVEEGETVSVSNLSVNIFDLTQMFGSTIADYIYSLEQSQAGAGVAWFKKLFPADYYPYSEPTIISSQTDRVDVAMADGTITQQITTNFPVLNSAGSVYDYIDLNEGKLHQRVGKVDLGTLEWLIEGGAYTFDKQTWLPDRDNFGAIINGYTFVDKSTDTTNMDKVYKAVRYTEGYGAVYIKDTTYTDAATFKSAMSGVMLYYELAEEVITDITIPTELTDWLTVEAGGSVTFHNADEGKRLLIPNKLSFVRKLDEVSV